MQKLVLKEDESFHEAARRLSRNNISYRNHNTFSDPTHQTANRSKPFSIETQSRLGRARNSTFSRELFVCYREGGVLQSWKNRNTNLLPLPPPRNRVFLSSWHRSRHRWGRLIARENGAPLMLSHFANLPVYTRAYIFSLSLFLSSVYARTRVQACCTSDGIKSNPYLLIQAKLNTPMTNVVSTSGTKYW